MADDDGEMNDALAGLVMKALLAVNLEAYSQSEGFLGFCEGDPGELVLPVRLGECWQSLKGLLGNYDAVVHQLELKRWAGGPVRTTAGVDEVVALGVTHESDGRRWKLSAASDSERLELDVLRNCMLDGVGGPCFFSLA